MLGQFLEDKKEIHKDNWWIMWNFAKHKEKWWSNESKQGQQKMRSKDATTNKKICKKLVKALQRKQTNISYHENMCKREGKKKE